MVKRYKGGLMGSTEAVTSSSDARGMWGTVQATQARNTGNWPALLTTETPGSGSGAGFANAFMTVSNVAVTDSNYTVLNDTPNISTAGGFIKITGRGFVSGCVVYVGGTPATTTTFISSTEVRAQIAAATSNTLMVYVVNPDGSTGIKLNSLVFSGTPSWVTGATLTSQVTDVVFSISFAATSDSAVTYLLNTGSTLPPGTALFANGLFTGTVTGLSSDTTYSFSVLANDAENQDTARTFSVTFGVGDSGFPLTSSLFNSDGNTWVRDASANNAFTTVGNDTRPSAFSPYNSNWSVLLPSIGDYLTVPAGTDFAYGTGDFTVDGWVYPTAVATFGSVVWSQTVGGTNYFVASINSSLRFAFTGTPSGGGTEITGPANSLISLNAWNHFAITRTSGSVRVYVNGLGGTATSNTTDFNNVSYVPTIGRYTHQGTDVNFTGYISNLRVVKGVAAFTGNFTVPTSLSTVTQSAGSNIAAITTGTVFLGLQTNRFIDANTTPKTITLVGTPQITSFAPLTETDAITGSAYFDGAGDHLIITDNAGMELGAGDFCVECWIYPTSVAGTAVVIDKRSGGFAPLLLWRSSSTLQIYMSLNGSSWGLANAVTVGALVVNQWYHVAVFRVGTSLYTSFNGVVSLVTASGSGTLVNNAVNWYIGTETNGSTNPWTGWIADMRFVVGSSPYGASTFIPPTNSLAAITGTQLLTLQSRTGENNHRFIDEAGTKALIARVNDVFQGTFSPHSPAGWSGYFDGTSTSYLNAVSNAAFAFGTGDFTLEAWIFLPVYPSAGTVAGQIISAHNWNGSGFDFGFRVNTAGPLYFEAVGGSNLTSTIVVPLGQWNHVACVRSSGTITFYINGLSRGSASITTSIPSTTAISLGHSLNGGLYGALTGYISNARVVKGVAVYTANFTPQTSSLSSTQSSGTNIAAITAGQTSLLTLQDNRFKDNSTNAFALTNGSSRIYPFSPFRASGAYSPTLHGGSAYFDGGTDYLTVPANSVFAFGTGDFTVECWAYITTTNTYMPLVQSDAIGGSTNNKWFFATTSTTLVFQTHSSGGFTATTPWTPGYGSWQHFAAVRQSGTMRLFVNGVSGTVTVTGTPSGYSLSQNGLTIGGMSTPYYLTGYISGLRLVTGQAVFTGNFAIPTAPPGLTQTSSTNVAAITSNVTMLTNFTHAGVVDYTGRNNIYTFTGPNIRSSNVQSKFGTGSLFFTGGYQYAFIGPGNNAAHPPLLPTIGDFTVECWVYATAGDTTLMCLHSNLSAFAAVRITLNANGSVGILASTTGSSHTINTASSASAFSFNTWQHLAYVRNGGTIAVYINGTSVVTSTTIAATTALMAGVESLLGALDNRNNSDFASFFQGYIDDFRVTRFARYTANFTPPTTTFLTR